MLHIILYRYDNLLKISLNLNPTVRNDTRLTFNGFSQRIQFQKPQVTLIKYIPLVFIDYQNKSFYHIHNPLSTPELETVLFNCKHNLSPLRIQGLLLDVNGCVCVLCR